jgi:acyl-CoA thioesterase FadM
MTGSHEVEIRWADLDGFGHVSHRAYLEFLEEARNAVLDAAIGPEQRRTFALRRLAIDYVAQLTQRDDDRVRVTVRITAVDGSSVTTEEEAASVGDGRVAARARAELQSDDAAAVGALRGLLEAPAQQG